MGLLYGRAGRLTAENGGFRPGQDEKKRECIEEDGLLEFNRSGEQRRVAVEKAQEHVRLILSPEWRQERECGHCECSVHTHQCTGQCAVQCSRTGAVVLKDTGVVHHRCDIKVTAAFHTVFAKLETASLLEIAVCMKTARSEGLWKMEEVLARAMELAGKTIDELRANPPRRAAASGAAETPAGAPRAAAGGGAAVRPVGNWTTEEDAQLRQAIAESGVGGWGAKAATFPGRNGRALGNRWKRIGAAADAACSGARAAPNSATPSTSAPRPKRHKATAPAPAAAAASDATTDPPTKPPRRTKCGQ